jgi:hypothetical protein
MTCVGLLGLAVGHGTRPDAAKRKERNAKIGLDPGDDPVLEKGFRALASSLVAPGPPVQAGLPFIQRGDRSYYFLWSLERVGVAYGVEKIGDAHWYDWGSRILLQSEHPQGGWHGAYGEGGVDTCFALLFLRRSNLTDDLTPLLRNRIRDPGQVTLKAGAFGEKKPLLKPAINNDPRPKDEGDNVAKANLGKDNPLTARPKIEAAEETDMDAGRLTKELVAASAKSQELLIGKCQKTPGAVYTQALADAIPKLRPSAQKRAREALVERLTRMTRLTLSDKLQDDDPEVRRAAALACANKEEKTLVPDLIELLMDTDRPVARAAHVALKELTQRDLGPAEGASSGERKKAVEEWKEWWRKQKG